MSLFRSRLRSVVKRALPYLQLLALYHRLRNRRTLTVVVFHRVLRRDDPRWLEAMPEWTVSDDLFEQCLVFFRRHYNLVGLHDLLASQRGGRRLPPRSLLVTFDDGYADNEEYALPLLRRHAVPAVLFLTTAFVDRRSRPWTEDLTAAYERGRVSREEVTELYQSLFPADSAESRDAAALLGEINAHWPGLTDSEVESVCSRALRRPLERLTTPVQMLSSVQVKRLHAAGVSIQAHGQTHASMPRSTRLDAELHEPRRTISDMLGSSPSDAVNALAFPYGDYSDYVVARALDAGYRLLFTFRSGIVPLPHGRLSSVLLDRINVSGPTLAKDGTSSGERLARYFFFQPRSQSPAPGGRV